MVNYTHWFSAVIWNDDGNFSVWILCRRSFCARREQTRLWPCVFCIFGVSSNKWLSWAAQMGIQRGELMKSIVTLTQCHLNCCHCVVILHITLHCISLLMTPRNFLNNNESCGHYDSTICVIAHTCYINTPSQMLLMLYSHFYTSADCVCVCASPSWVWSVDDDLMCQVSFTPVLAWDTVKLIEPKH